MLTNRPHKVLPNNSTSHEIITEVLCTIHADHYDDSIAALNTLVAILNGTYQGKHLQRGYWMRIIAKLEDSEFAAYPVINTLISEQRAVTGAIEKNKKSYTMPPKLVEVHFKREIMKIFPKDREKVDKYVSQERDLYLSNLAKKVDEIQFQKSASTIIQGQYYGDEAPKIIAGVLALIQQDTRLKIIPAIFKLHKLLQDISANVHVCQGEWLTALKSLTYFESVNPALQKFIEQADFISNNHQHNKDGLIIHNANPQFEACNAWRSQLGNSDMDLSILAYSVPAAVVAALALITVVALKYTIPGKIMSNWAYNQLSHKFGLFKVEQLHRDDDVEANQRLLGDEQRSWLAPSNT